MRLKLLGASAITLGLIGSFVFFIIILVALYVGTIDLGFAIGLTIVINFLMWLVGPWCTDWINKWIYKVQFLTPEQVAQQYPHLSSLINDIATKSNFPHPKVGFINDNNPQAFCYGSGRWNSRLVFTAGITKYLNEDEQRAVIAHELGHIYNRDFVVMMVASTLVQVLYEIYATLSRGSKGGGNSKGKGAAVIIAFAAYILYWISTYLLLYLSRTREKLADEFSAQHTHADDLATALIKIAYGIVTEEDSNSTTRLLNSTRHMGLVDVKNAKATGSIVYIAHNDRNVLSEAMLFDSYNPWAWWLELNSTHPLTGKRIQLLSQVHAEKGHSKLSYDVEGAAERIRLDRSKLWSNFFTDVSVVWLLPLALAVASGITVRSFGAAMIGYAVGLIVGVIYRYPRGESQATTILDEMRNPYSSPVRGKNIQIEGTPVGRGVAGYIFSEDLMYQDKSGLIFVNFHHAFAFLGNLYFALAKVKKLFGLKSTAVGWFHRGMASQLTLRTLTVHDGGGSVIKSWTHVWAFALPLLLAGTGVIIYLFEQMPPA